jgi:hypothetical protein
MPKPFLHPDDERLEVDAVETMLAGLKEWRPDLNYPESHSDMQACFRAVLRMFELKRRPLPRPLRLRCPDCEGTKLCYLKAEPGFVEKRTCPRCHGRGWVPEEQ